MKFEQRKRSNRHTFTFGSDALNFAYKDNSGSGDVDTPYGDIPKKTSVLIEHNAWVRNVGYLWCVLGCIQLGYSVMASEPSVRGGLWLLLGAVCTAWSHLTKVKYTVFQAPNGNLFVIQDNRTHDRIVDEIMSRRRTQLRLWYDHVDASQSLKSELAKFKWLQEQEAITSEEAAQRVAQVHLEYGAAASSSPGTLN